MSLAKILRQKLANIHTSFCYAKNVQKKVFMMSGTSKYSFTKILDSFHQEMYQRNKQLPVSRNNLSEIECILVRFWILVLHHYGLTANWLPPGDNSDYMN